MREGRRRWRQPSFFDRCLGPRDAELLRAALDVNGGTGTRSSKARSKLLALHARGDVDFSRVASGGVSAPEGALPPFLSWIGRDWRDSSCPSALLDGVYRIVRARPSVLQK